MRCPSKCHLHQNRIHFLIFLSFEHKSSSLQIKSEKKEKKVEKRQPDLVTTKRPKKKESKRKKKN